MERLRNYLLAMTRIGHVLVGPCNFRCPCWVLCGSHLRYPGYTLRVPALPIYFIIVVRSTQHMGSTLLVGSRSAVRGEEAY